MDGFLRCDQTPSLVRNGDDWSWLSRCLDFLQVGGGSKGKGVGSTVFGLCGLFTPKKIIDTVDTFIFRNAPPP